MNKNMAIWGKDETMALIELYRDNTCLWKVADSEYRNHSKRKAAINEIASSMQSVRPGITAKEIQAKINGLRTQYSEQLRKQKKMSDSSAGCTKVVWCFGALQFLRECVVPRKTGASNCHYLQEEADTAWDNVALEENYSDTAMDNSHVCTEQLSNNQSEIDALPRRSKKRTNSQMFTNGIQSIDTKHFSHSPTPGTTSSHANDDNFAFFGAYIASELRSIKDPLQQHLCQMDIQQVIFKRKCPLLRVSTDPSSCESTASFNTTRVKMEELSPPTGGNDVNQSFEITEKLSRQVTDNCDSSADQYCVPYIPL